MQRLEADLPIQRRLPTRLLQQGQHHHLRWRRGLPLGSRHLHHHRRNLHIGQPVSVSEWCVLRLRGRLQQQRALCLRRQMQVRDERHLYQSRRLLSHHRHVLDFEHTDLPGQQHVPACHQRWDVFGNASTKLQPGYRLHADETLPVQRRALPQQRPVHRLHNEYLRWRMVERALDGRVFLYQ